MDEKATLEKMTKIINAFIDISGTYIEGFVQGSIIINCFEKDKKIIIAKPKSHEFPLFLNVTLETKEEIVELDLVTEIVIDICQKLEFMDSKLEKKFDILLSDEPRFIEFEGKKIRIN